MKKGKYAFEKTQYILIKNKKNDRGRKKKITATEREKVVHNLSIEFQYISRAFTHVPFHLYLFIYYTVCFQSERMYVCNSCQP